MRIILARKHFTTVSLLGITVVIAATIAIWLRFRHDVNIATNSYSAIWRTVSPDKSAVLVEHIDHKVLPTEKASQGIKITCLSRGSVDFEIAVTDLSGCEYAKIALERFEKKEGAVSQCEAMWTSESIIIRDLHDEQCSPVSTAMTGSIQATSFRQKNKEWMLYLTNGVHEPVYSLQVVEKPGGPAKVVQIWVHCRSL